MNTKKIYDFIDKKRRLDFDSQVALAKKLGMTRQSYNTYMNRLAENKAQHPFNRVCAFLKELGYDLVIVPKN